MVYFNVIPNGGHYRATFHEFKLVFLFKTTVVKKEADSIPMFGFSFVPFNDVLKYDDSFEHLIDVMGVLTVVFPKRQYEKDGKVTTMVVMELTDAHGKLECSLFGEYVDELKNFLHQGGNIQVVVVVQLARVKTFRGKTVIQNSMNATKLFFNPDIAEAISFRNSVVEHGVLDVEPLDVVLDNSKEGLEVDFMKLHPKKTISELEDIQEDGMFVVLANIVDIISDGSWFYLACKCNRAVTIQSDVYFCESCRVPVLQVSPRFKDVSGNGYPSLLDSLIGQKILFKVETKVEQQIQFEGSYAVKRVCVDEDIIAMFELSGVDCTPTKAIFAPPFPKVSNDDLEEPFHDIVSKLFVAPINLGDDDFHSEVKCTPAKRN